MGSLSLGAIKTPLSIQLVRESLRFSVGNQP
jgi:hypothetical protein